MCTSVPQIPVRSTLISTSLIPIRGTGTLSSQSPGLASFLTRASIVSICNILPGYRRDHDKDRDMHPLLKPSDESGCPQSWRAFGAELLNLRLELAHFFPGD